MRRKNENGNGKKNSIEDGRDSDADHAGQGVQWPEVEECQGLCVLQVEE